MKNIVIWDGPSTTLYGLIGAILLFGFGIKVMEVFTPVLMFLIGIVAIVVMIAAFVMGVQAGTSRNPGDLLGRYVGWFGGGMAAFAAALNELFGTVTKNRGFWPFSWTEKITTPTGHFAQNLLISSSLILLVAAGLGIITWFCAGRQNLPKGRQLHGA